MRDVDTDTTLLASPGTADDVDSYDLSGDGAYVAFTTTTTFAGVNDANGVSDVYRRNLTSGSTVLVSRQAGSALAGNAASRDPSISDDGRWVAYTSNATNLVGGGYVDGPANDVFARDVTAGAGYLVSSKFGTTLTGANSSSNNPQIAGTPVVPADVYVAYNSDATDVAAPGTDDSAAESVYRRRLTVASSSLVSRADGPGANADSRAHVGGISDSGARVSFASDAGNLTPGADYYGAYVRDLVAGSTILASVDTAYSVEAMISGDGSFVSWINGSGGITPDSDPELVGVFGRAYPDGPPEYVSRPPGTAPFLAPADRRPVLRRGRAGDQRRRPLRRLRRELPPPSRRHDQTSPRSTVATCSAGRPSSSRAPPDRKARPQTASRARRRSVPTAPALRSRASPRSSPTTSTRPRRRSTCATSQPPPRRWSRARTAPVARCPT